MAEHSVAGAADARYAAYTCVLVASLLQYLRFAKKPLAAPLHRVTDRMARRFALVGMVLELCGLWLLPLSQAYPMNASCLVCVFFWKETKRSKAMQFGEALACLAALGTWFLPVVDPDGGHFPHAVQDAVLLEEVLAPRTCAFASCALIGGVVVYCAGGASALGMTAGPGMSFGVSALLLKALLHNVALLASEFHRPELWGSAVALLAVLLWLRGAAASPLRRALESHDKLRVLASYGLMSSLASSFAGSLVFLETHDWSLERRLLSFGLAVAHCWGMATLASRPASGERDLAEDDRSASPKAGGVAASAVDVAAGRAIGAGKILSGSSLELSSIGGSSPEGPLDGPLLNFGSTRTVDEDSMMEDQLLARALAPDMGQQFDADFEEIMRRFDEDDRKMVGSEAAAGVGEHAIVPQIIAEDSAASPFGDFGAFGGDAPPAVAAAPFGDFAAFGGDAQPVSAAPSAPMDAAVAMDAQTMMDVFAGAADDEDTLLQDIQDIEEL
eukprot:TRINITY_DN20261_c0_g1_i3.p1 TRINITY_DN20261_c0_g1~~TRINITY_DN20261_c0_g1_i3.p1  ORF type:complete len:515 (+),score=125.94 TRINITY_DN20261_c0_g1_i3:44-1546(+)